MISGSANAATRSGMPAAAEIGGAGAHEQYTTPQQLAQGPALTVAVGHELEHLLGGGAQAAERDGPGASDDVGGRGGGIGRRVRGGDHAEAREQPELSAGDGHRSR